jgi:hypothetical protein
MTKINAIGSTLMVIGLFALNILEFELLFFLSAEKRYVDYYNEPFSNDSDSENIAPIVSEPEPEPSLVPEPLPSRKRRHPRQTESQSKRARASVALQEQDRSFEKLTEKFDYFFKEHDICFTNNLIWPLVSKK